MAKRRRRYKRQEKSRSYCTYTNQIDQSLIKIVMVELVVGNRFLEGAKNVWAVVMFLIGIYGIKEYLTKKKHGFEQCEGKGALRRHEWRISPIAGLFLKGVKLSFISLSFILCLLPLASAVCIGTAPYSGNLGSGVSG